MLSSVVVVALAALARAAPLNEERAVTVTEVTDVYTTVWADAPAETVAAADDSTTKAQWWWKGHRGGAKTTVVYVTPTAAPAAPSPVADTPAPSYAAPSSAAPAPTTIASSGGAPNDYAQKVVDHHNAHRANHSAPALSWDAATAATALKIAQTCNYAHNTAMDGGGYGQNIAAGCPADNITSVITDLFYNAEVVNFHEYGQKTPADINTDAFDGYGHFTQIVWKGTTLVGCATYDCSNSGGLQGVGSSTAPIFTVCNYKSAGNFLGEFDSNVGEPLGHPSISWSS